MICDLVEEFVRVVKCDVLLLCFMTEVIYDVALVLLNILLTPSVEHEVSSLKWRYLRLILW